jgi:hypothetical protein
MVQVVVRATWQTTIFKGAPSSVSGHEFGIAPYAFKMEHGALFQRDALDFYVDLFIPTIERDRLPEIDCSASSLILAFREIFGVRPKLTDRHAKVVADRSHYVTRGVGPSALYSSQIIGAIAKGFRKRCL